MAGGIRGGGDDIEELHEINVTPFIDVMLVLLIIFMVAAPLATVGVPVDLPTSSAQAAPNPDKPLYLTIQRDLALSLGDAPVARDALGVALDAMTGGNRDTRIFLRADQAVAYGQIMQTMNLLRAAGYLKVALVGLDAAQSSPAP
ncbi:TonB system transport protein ExbD [Fuscibacter oryzae]|uniref:Biopolymer transport protein ExbD n=1 Tax=Fuscibacter oryzae TaxID=2803939 RepID=A0A8J7MR11_9RHOB|nr:TonB system transport protein ExbD [Fuscibacter oryzae]MBL4928608.1 TonB system transport protein ExbD [Fuscibacter oryzae]